jgi:hypothetical protein
MWLEPLIRGEFRSIGLGYPEHMRRLEARLFWSEGIPEPCELKRQNPIDFLAILHTQTLHLSANIKNSISGIKSFQKQYQKT